MNWFVCSGQHNEYEVGLSTVSTFLSCVCVGGGGGGRFLTKMIKKKEDLLRLYRRKMKKYFYFEHFKNN